MKRIVFVGAFALLAACGDSSPDASGSTATVQTSVATTSASTGAADSTDATTGDTTVDTTAVTAPADTVPAASDDTINVSNFGDMPPACVELFTTFLKQIEPKVEVIDWEKATLGEFEAFGSEFQAESDDFDAKSTAAGCDKYNFDASDADVFEQISALAATEAPGTIPFLQFLNALSATATADAEGAPADCAGTIAAIEPFLVAGNTMKSLTIAEVTRIGSLMTAIGTKCTAEESSAFYAREDVTAFVSG